MNDTRVSSEIKPKTYHIGADCLNRLAGLIAVPFFNSVYITVLLITIMSFVILTVAWALFSGPTGYVSLAPAAFFGIGMYTAAILGKQMPFFGGHPGGRCGRLCFCLTGRRHHIKIARNLFYDFYLRTGFLDPTVIDLVGG